MVCLAIWALGPCNLLVFVFLNADRGLVSAAAHTTYVVRCALFCVVTEPLTLFAAQWFGDIGLSREGSPNPEVYSGGNLPFEGY